jgi:hypothetical protein
MATIWTRSEVDTPLICFKNPYPPWWQEPRALLDNAYLDGEKHWHDLL